MPVFAINTNVAAEKIPKDFLESCTDVVAKALGKPASYVVVNINPNQRIAFGGDAAAPCATCTLSSIGCISASQNKKSSALLSAHLNSQLGIPADRMYITFVDLQPSNVGFNGGTF